jgi:peptidoglycan/LPS O-acetylase OafA/YrhL
MRGIAALVVLTHHAALLFPALAATYFSRSATVDGAAVWWLTHTPLHLLWEGDSAVFIFFVLSGVVLTLPFVEKPFRAKAFFPQRLVRLYLPIWAAVILAATTVYLVPRIGGTGNEWLDARVQTVTPTALVRDLTLVRGPGGLASPLWSLQWEILFSLALPVYLWLALRWRGHLAAKVAIAIAITAFSTFLGGTAELVLRYAPMFMVGVVMVMERRTLTSWADWISRQRRYWPFLFSTGALLLVTRWYVIPITTNAVVQDLTIAFMVLGAVIIIFCSMYWLPLMSILERAPAQWLGKVSFSLYLIHEPILVTLGYLFGSDQSPWAAAAGFALSLAAAPLFFRWIEHPSHRLAKAVAAKTTRGQQRPVPTSGAVFENVEPDLTERT